jgi:hypothetical protein
MPQTTTMAAEVLEEILDRRAVPGRPADLEGQHRHGGRRRRAQLVISEHPISNLDGTGRRSARISVRLPNLDMLD